MEHVIQVNSLSFQYSKSVKVLDNISINVPKGSIYGFLGPNGAGKSTTMSLLTGLIPEQNDAIRLFGEPLSSQLPMGFTRIGSLIESPALHLHLSGYDNLKYIAKIKRVAETQIAEILDLIDLIKDKDRKAKQYSLGMKQRLAIGMALLGDPELLLLDEPVNGLDPNGIIEIRKLLIRINKEKGVTIFVSSHLLSEIEKMCTHVAIINHGKLKFEGTMKELSIKTSFLKVQITISQGDEFKDVLVKEYDSIRFINENQFTLNLDNKESIPDLIKDLVSKGISIYEIKALDGLEEWFMTLTDNN